jgi:hypothetical protein
MSLQQVLIVAVSLFCLLSFYLIFHHEQHLSATPPLTHSPSSTKSHFFDTSQSVLSRLKHDFVPSSFTFSGLKTEDAIASGRVSDTGDSTNTKHDNALYSEEQKHHDGHHDEHHDSGSSVVKPLEQAKHMHDTLVQPSGVESPHSSTSETSEEVAVDEEGEEKRGLLQCDGKYIDSEVIYWKIVPGDNTYESPITPHHDLHHDRYLTYEYDEGGWNNIRMSLECVLVFTHAMGRTLVSPPRQNLYLVDKKYKAKDGKVRSGMGFEDFFDLDLLKSHKGYHVMTAEQFLAKEGVTGGLHGILPPKNSTKIGGRKW